MLSLKRIFLLGLAVAGLWIYHIYADFHARDDAQAVIESKRLTALPEGQTVTALRIEKAGAETMELVKEANHWWLRTPKRYPAEDFIADGLVAAIVNTTWERSFGLADMKIEEVGLDSPIQKITLTLSGAGEKPRALLIGREAPTGHYLYAMWEGGDRIFMLHEQFARAFEKSLYAVRKKRLFDVPSEEIYAADVYLEDKKFTLVKWNGKWQAVAGDSQPADPAVAEAFLSEVTSLYAREFLDQLNPENSDLGFNPKKYYLSLTSASGGTAVVWFGPENKEKGDFYALKEGEDLVMFVAGERIKELPAGIEHFQPKPVVRVDSENIRKIQIKKLGEELDLVKIDRQWQFESDQTAVPAKLNEAVNDLVLYLQQVRLQPSAGRTEKPQPESSISFKFVSEKENSEYTFYNAGREALVQSSLGASLYAVDGKVWKELEEYFKEVSDYKKV